MTASNRAVKVSLSRGDFTFPSTSVCLVPSVCNIQPVSTQPGTKRPCLGPHCSTWCRGPSPSQHLRTKVTTDTCSCKRGSPREHGWSAEPRDSLQRARLPVRARKGAASVPELSSLPSAAEPEMRFQGPTTPDRSHVTEGQTHGPARSGSPSTRPARPSANKMKLWPLSLCYFRTFLI